MLSSKIARLIVLYYTDDKLKWNSRVIKHMEGFKFQISFFISLILFVAITSLRVSACGNKGLNSESGYFIVVLIFRKTYKITILICSLLSFRFLTYYLRSTPFSAWDEIFSYLLIINRDNSIFVHKQKRCWFKIITDFFLKGVLYV